jgi:heat shock protein HtpX
MPFHPLPAQTVFEARRSAAQATLMLCGLLVLAYGLTFCGLGLVAWLLAFAHFGAITSLSTWMLISAGGGAALALGNVWLAYEQSLDDSLAALAAKWADPKDPDLDLVRGIAQEREPACGAGPLLVAVQETRGLNAFALMDKQGQAVLGVTRGLLSALDRAELEAVLAHEAAHIIHHDARLNTFASGLLDALSGLTDNLGGEAERFQGPYLRREQPSIFLLKWVVQLGYGLSLFLRAALSRQREYLADAHAVEICSMPQELADALFKIATRSRGGGELPRLWAPVFIMNPLASSLDEADGLAAGWFSTHPPVAQRIQRLLAYAGANRQAIPLQVFMEGRMQGAAADGYYFKQSGHWVGPLSAQALMAQEDINASSWVCPGPQQAPVRLYSIAALAEAWRQRTDPMQQDALRCPRCHRPLQDGALGWACAGCGGSLLLAEDFSAGPFHLFQPERLAAAWLGHPSAGLEGAAQLPGIDCPACHLPMQMGSIKFAPQVVLDRCKGRGCGAVWFDQGELEGIQRALGT